MSRWTRIFSCGVVLFLGFARCHAQQPPVAMQTSESVYPDSSEGLQAMLHDTVEAVRSRDAAKEAALIHLLIMPEDGTWFKDEFGQAFGPRLAAAYQKAKPLLEQDIRTIYEGNAERGWSQPKIFRYADAAAVDSPIDNYLNCMETVVPLYQTAFNGNYRASNWAPVPNEPGRSKAVAGDLSGFYVYVKDGFRFVPEQIFFMLPKGRPIRIQLDMDAMRSKITNDVDGHIQRDTIKSVMNLHVFGKVVIHFVLDTNGKIKEINATEGPTALIGPFMQQVKQWNFEPTTLDGEAVEVEVNFQTGLTVQR